MDPRNEGSKFDNFLCFLQVGMVREAPIQGGSRADNPYVHIMGPVYSDSSIRIGEELPKLKIANYSIPLKYKSVGQINWQSSFFTDFEGTS